MVVFYVIAFSFAVLAVAEAFAIDTLNKRNLDLKEKLWDMSGLEPVYLEPWEIEDEEKEIPTT